LAHSSKWVRADLARSGLTFLKAVFTLWRKSP